MNETIAPARMIVACFPGPAPVPVVGEQIEPQRIDYNGHPTGLVTCVFELSHVDDFGLNSGSTRL